MNKEISRQSRQELVDAIRERYRRASKQEKARILDEFVSLTGYHRKHAIRGLGPNKRRILFAKFLLPYLPKSHCVRKT